VDQPHAVRQEVGASADFVAGTVEVVADRFASAAEMAREERLGDLKDRTDALGLFLLRQSRVPPPGT
jgi:hypothetical protein